MKRVMITTLDNPFDPFIQFDEWFAFDVLKGYNTSSYLARVVYSSDALGELDQQQAIERGVDEIIQHNSLGIYKKVFEK